MKNVYNKSRYRSREWAKHLRPYLKRVGNKRWRRTSKNLHIHDEPEEIVMSAMNSGKALKKNITVKFKIQSLGHTYSYKARYSNMRSALDAMRRHNVIDAVIIKDES